MKGRPRATGPLGDFEADTAGAGATGVPVAVAGCEIGVVVPSGTPVPATVLVMGVPALNGGDG